MPTPTTPEQRAQRIKMIAQIALFTGIGLIAGPIAAFAIKGLLGLLACGAVGLAAITFGPVIGDKAANWRLKMLKAEATRNPVETLQNEYMRKQQVLEENLQSIGKLRTQIATFRDKVEGFVQLYPTEAEKFQAQLTGMEDLLTAHEDKYTETSNAVTLFGAEIEKADAVWKMSLAAAEAAEGTQLTIEDFTQEIKTKTSLESIQGAMNASFSQLDNLRLRNRQTRQLTNSTTLLK